MASRRCGSGSSRATSNAPGSAKSSAVRPSALAVIITYLALAALFESFRDPLIILVSVPMSIAGALLFVWLGIGGASINLFTEVGLVTLMGLISKHGILIVDVANRLQREGYSKRDAVEEAAGVRLRPILMTTAAMAAFFRSSHALPTSSTLLSAV